MMKLLFWMACWAMASTAVVFMVYMIMVVLDACKKVDEIHECLVAKKDDHGMDTN